MDADRRKGTVLIVDDDRTVHQVTEAILAKEGYTFEHAYSGQEAIECILAREPDVVLLDVMMPTMNGFDTCRSIRALNTSAYLPIMMVTALDGAKDLTRGLNAGADDFISKPTPMMELRARVRSLIRIREQNLEMVKQAQQLARLDRQREDLVRMVVHDLRSPLTAVQLAASALLDTSHNLTEEQRNDLKLIRAESTRVGNYLEEMLLLARQEAGKLRLSIQSLNLTTIVEESLTSLKPVAQARDIRLINDSRASTQSEPLKGDRALLRRVVDNLLTNAIKFSPPHSAVRTRVNSTTRGVNLDVDDEGPGVPAEMRAKIFEKYEIVKMRWSGGPQTGLGLPFCRMVVEAHGGTIDCREGPRGIGSRFHVHLPKSHRQER